MTEVLAHLRDRLKTVEDERARLLSAIRALQDVCPHDWKETGYDPRGSTTTYYQCQKCGAEKRT